MHLEPDTLYHIYNMGNNHGRLFFSHRNYLFFTQKLNFHICRQADILAYCLMPNHFHVMICTKVNFDRSELSNNLRVALSSYARAINRQEGRVGSLFRQNTKAEDLEISHINYPVDCFRYIHRNPLEAGIVQNLEDWQYSSYLEYTAGGVRKICNRIRAQGLLDIPVARSEFRDWMDAV